MDLIRTKKSRRIHITAVDGRDRKNNDSITVYDTTPQEVIKLIEKHARKGTKQKLRAECNSSDSDEPAAVAAA